MDILRLTPLNNNPTKDWGHNGYITNQIYEVTKTCSFNLVTFILTKIDKEYKKIWEITLNDIEIYNRIIKEGHSFGAFENSELIGMVICEARKWNNTLYVENILISENYRGKGVGQKLIEKVINHSKINKFRLIELETQNTNVPAIEFYLKQGFNITGINLKLYNGDAGKETAFFMTCDNESDNNL